jgi:Fe-S-cluster-containing hydrogenase component 2
MVVIIDKSSCTGCSACADECPAEAIALENEIAAVDADACVDCGSCVDVCPADAISLE